MKKTIRIPLLKILPGLAAALLALPGCVQVSFTPESPVVPAIQPLRRADRQQISRRCAAVKRVLAPLKVRGIGLYPRAFGAEYSPEQLCRFIADCGFNRIYFYITSESELDDRLTAFLAAAGKHRIGTEIVLRQSYFYARSRGNLLLRECFTFYPRIPEAVQLVARYNRNLPPEVRKIEGVTLVAEPHKFTANHAGVGEIYAWRDTAFGAGGDNDMLMRGIFEQLAEVDPGNMRLTVAFPDFYHDLAAAQKVTKGTTADFMKSGKNVSGVMLLASAGKPSSIVAGSAAEFAASNASQQILLGIELAEHASLNGDKLRRRDWSDLTRILGYVIREHRKYPAFRGVVISPLAVFEYLMMEKN